MKLRLSLGVLAGAILMQAAGPSHARDLTRVWDVKQRCFREAKSGECGGTYNVTTRTYVSAASQKAGTTAADAQLRPTEAAPKQPAALLPSQALRELAEKAAAEEAAPKQDAAEKPAAAPAAATAEAPAKAAPTQEEWDVATPAKPKTERKAEAAAAAETKKPAKSAESTERPRGIRRTKADG